MQQVISISAYLSQLATKCVLARRRLLLRRLDEAVLRLVGVRVVRNRQLLAVDLGAADEQEPEAALQPDPPDQQEFRLEASQDLVEVSLVLHAAVLPHQSKILTQVRINQRSFIR